MANLSATEAFAMVVDVGSFSGAAKRLGVSTSYASKLVTRLEDQLSVRLLHRTTRRLTLTEAGSAYYERVRLGLAILAEAEAEATELSSSAVGTLRVTMPTGLGVAWLSGPLAQFAASHPRLTIEASYSDTHVDLLARGLDVAVRAGDLPDSSLVAVKLAALDKEVFASPAYLSAHGVPMAPADVPQHACLLYSQGAGPREWRLERRGESVSVSPPSRFVANNGDALVHAAVEGLGLVYLPAFHAARQVAAGTLVRVLPGWGSQTHLYAVYPTTQHVPSKVRLWIAFLREALQPPPWSCCGVSVCS